MTRTDDAPGRHQDGFEGEISGLGLADLLQLKARSRFSGCFHLRNGDRLGLVFFRDGEVVHAECGTRAGEEALLDILEWPAGRFGIDPNVVTAQRTIHKTCEHLLLDAHRALDERRASETGRQAVHLTRSTPPAPRPPPATAALFPPTASPPAPGPASAGPVGSPPPAPPAAAAPPVASPPGPPSMGAAAAVRSLQALPGVAGAVVVTRDGRLVGGEGRAAELLAGQAAYLAMVAAELGAAFDAGPARATVVEGTRHHLLLLAAKNHYLCVLAHPDADMGALEAAVRRALGGG